MCLVHFRDLCCERACIDYEPHGDSRGICRLVRQWGAQVEMVHDDVHESDPSASGLRREGSLTSGRVTRGELRDSS